MRAQALVALFLLSGCGGIETDHARDPYGAMIGMSVPDLLSCAGHPDHVDQTGPDTLTVEWDYHATPRQLFSAKVVLLGSVEVGGDERSCKMVATVLRDGTVADVAFPGRDAAVTVLPYAGCDVLVKECVDHPSATGLPPGYDSFRYLLHGTEKE